MNFEAFVCAILACTKEKLRNDEQAEIQRITKNNGTVMVGLSVRKEGEAVAPILYLEPFYQLFQEETPLEELAELFLEKIRIAAQMPKWNFEEMFEFMKVKDKIAFKLINTKRNEQFLKEVPHFEVLDFSVVFYLSVSIAESEHGAVMIRNNHLDWWQITPSVLYECAKENMPKLYPAVLCPMSELIPLEFWNTYGPDPILVLTNSTGNFGAATILYKQIPEKIYEKVQGPYYLLPASVHEFLVVPENYEISKENLAAMVREINGTQIPPAEVLSDTVYFFDGNNITEM